MISSRLEDAMEVVLAVFLITIVRLVVPFVLLIVLGTLLQNRKHFI
jgi:hypothetical protein